MATNINDYKRRLNDFKEADDQVRAAIEYSKIAVWYFDDTRTPLRLCLDCPPSQPVRMNWTTVRYTVMSEFQDVMTEALRKALTAGEQLSLDVPIARREVGWQIVRGVATGRPGELMGVFIDMSDIKEAVLALEEKKRLVEEGLATKSNFLMKISKSLQNPLYGICSLVKLLSAETSNPEQNAMITVVAKSLDKLTALIEDTIVLSKIDRGVFDVDYKKFDAREVLAKKLAPFQRLAKQKGLLFTIDIEPSFPLLVWGEAVCFGRVVAGLTSNAVKFTSCGSVNVRVRYTVVEEEALIVSIEDTGIGISDEDQTRVFEWFTQGDSSCTRIYEGIGVGLGLIRGILQLLRGTISLHSKLGVGSAFAVSFPFKSLLCSYVPPGIRNAKRHICVQSVIMLHKIDLLKTFVDFYGCCMVSEPEIDYNRLALICIDNSEVQKTRALQIQARAMHLVNILVLTDEDIIDPENSTFSHIRASTWVLRAAEILRATVTHGTLSVVTSRDMACLSQHLRFLAIFGDPADALALKAIIEKLECNAIIASTAEDGLIQLRTGQFDAAILNSHLRLSDGQIIGDIILSDLDTYRRIPLVVALEAVASQTDLEWCRRFGLRFFLRKPFTIKNVSDVLHLATGQ
jgi:signal transduction histidine kinase